MSKVNGEKTSRDDRGDKDPSNWAEEKVMQENRILELYQINIR